VRRGSQTLPPQTQKTRVQEPGFVSRSRGCRTRTLKHGRKDYSAKRTAFGKSKSTSFRQIDKDHRKQCGRIRPEHSQEVTKQSTNRVASQAWEKSDQAVQARFSELGERRCQEGIPLPEVLWALVLTKDRLLEYLGAYALANSAMELYQQQELDRLIGHFFDRAVCYTAAGYERQASEKKTSGEDGELRR
jgi:hypothetical protein